MTLRNDLHVLYHLALSPVRGRSHAERLESFYSGQAEAYDAFRKRLLQGREELYRSLQLPAGGTWLDLGGGTGANLEFVGEALHDVGQVRIVDLSPSLLEIAGKRIEHRGWTNVATVEADATQYVPPEGQVDLVTFSYALTMIPDWFSAIDHACRLLKPGGTLGVVDFYVSRKYPDSGFVKHSWRTRTFWPLWFGSDNVNLNPDHVPYLHRLFTPLHFAEHRARVPYVPLGRVPYYVFVGRKPTGDSTA